MQICILPCHRVIGSGGNCVNQNRRPLVDHRDSIHIYSASLGVNLNCVRNPDVALGVRMTWIQKGQRGGVWYLAYNCGESVKLNEMCVKTISSHAVCRPDDRISERKLLNIYTLVANNSCQNFELSVDK